MDQARDELPSSDIRGRNPFKDRRVREAMSLAIDAQAIHSSLMQGHSAPTALLWAPSVFGYAAEDDVRPPVDAARARQLLQDAGYPAGFAVTLDCPRDRYVNDERICQAVGAQLARIGVRVTVNVMPFNLYVGKLQRAETSFYLLGWATPIYDTYVTLQALVRTRGQGADGTNNFGSYSNPALDALIDRIKFEADLTERYRLVREAGRMIRDDVAYIPLHHQTIMWAMRANIEAVLPPENQLDVKWVRIRK
jgi:peptide/nickel transport system substrate-binding protein